KSRWALHGDACTDVTLSSSPLSLYCCFQFDSFVKSGTVLQNYATVLELLLRLRQACNHPFLVLESLNKSRKKVRASLVRLRPHTQYSLTGRLWRETRRRRRTSRRSWTPSSSRTRPATS